MMDVNDAVRMCGVICDEVVRELVEHQHQHHCIEGAALMMKVLHQRGFSEAYPLAVQVEIFNKAFQEYIETYGPPNDEVSRKALNDTGAASIRIGGRAEEIPKSQWPGHVVVVVPGVIEGRHILLDPTIIQAEKPEWGIRLQPLILLVKDQFASGEAPHRIKVLGSLLIYHAFPDDHSYSDAGDLMAIGGLDEAALHVLGRLNRRE
jgi:hypothetical protein